MLLSSDWERDHASTAQSIAGKINLFSIPQLSRVVQGTRMALTTADGRRVDGRGAASTVCFAGRQMEKVASLSE